MLIFRRGYIFSVFFLLLTSLTGCSTKPINEPNTFSLNTARYGHAVVNDGNKVYVIAGSKKKHFLSDIEIINPVTQETQVLADKVIPRRYFSAVWDGKHSIYILGGISLQKKQYRYETRVEIFNTQTNEVTFGKPMPMPTRINTAVLVDNKIFVLGGTYPKNNQITASALVTVFDIYPSHFKMQNLTPENYH